MKRRRFVQALSAVPAASLLPAQQAPNSSGADRIPNLDVGVADSASDPVPHFFTPTQLSTLRKLSDLVLPRIGDTPGALEAHTPEFLDFLIGDSPADRQKLYRTGLDSLAAQSHAKFGRNFSDLDSTQADTVLAPLHQPWTWATPADPLAAFLKAAKADILTATVNSREWISVVSKRSRSASGTAIYWRPIE